jgi:hypothetical protein
MKESSLFIYIELNEAQKISYFKEQIKWVKNTFPQIHIIEFDNFSDGILVDIAIDQIKKSTNIFVLIEVKNNTSEPGLITRFLNSLTRLKEKNFHFIFNGNYVILERMVKTFGEENVDHNLTLEEQIDQISHFFRSSN